MLSLIRKSSCLSCVAIVALCSHVTANMNGKLQVTQYTCTLGYIRKTYVKRQDSASSFNHAQAKMEKLYHPYFAGNFF